MLFFCDYGQESVKQCLWVGVCRGRRPHRSMTKIYGIQFFLGGTNGNRGATGLL